MSVVLITGAATGIGNLTAKALAAAGHTVYASMRDPAGRNAAHAREFLGIARRNSVDLRVVELDVQSQESAGRAAKTVLGEVGQLNVIVHNAGRLVVGYAEAFTAEDIARLFDINVLGAQRVNRAVLPHMRARRSGTLLYVGSTTSVDVPPFMGPYVASKSGVRRAGPDHAIRGQPVRHRDHDHHARRIHARYRAFPERQPRER